MARRPTSAVFNNDSLGSDIFDFSVPIPLNNHGENLGFGTNAPAFNNIINGTDIARPLPAQALISTRTLTYVWEAIQSHLSRHTLSTPQEWLQSLAFLVYSDGVNYISIFDRYFSLLRYVEHIALSRWHIVYSRSDIL